MIRLPGRLESAVVRSATAPTKQERSAAALEVAQLLREGAELSPRARDALARLFAGELRPKRGRPRADVAPRLVFALDFRKYYALNKAANGMAFDEAIERFAKMKGVKEGAAREWVSTRKK